MKFSTIFYLVMATAVISFIYFSYYHIVQGTVATAENFTNMEIFEILNDDSITPDNKIGALMKIVDKTYIHHDIIVNNNLSDGDKVSKLLELINNVGSVTMSRIVNTSSPNVTENNATTYAPVNTQHTMSPNATTYAPVNTQHTMSPNATTYAPVNTQHTMSPNATTSAAAMTKPKLT